MEHQLLANPTQAVSAEKRETSNAYLPVGTVIFVVMPDTLTNVADVEVVFIPLVTFESKPIVPAE